MTRSDAMRVAIVSLLAVGCATANVRPSAPYQGNRAYLYGRFTIQGQAMAFAIRCYDGAVYKIHFQERDEVQMIELAPSTCQLDEIVYGASGQRMAAFRMLRNEILDAGGVYYVGDYRASGTSTYVFMGLYNEIRSTWRMGHARDDYARTTAQMRQAFPQFASAATQDRVAH
jgi:hypothetical protein